MPAHNAACRWTLIAHFFTAMVIGIPCLFFVGEAANWIHWWWYDYTMVKILGAAVVALGIGSLLAARDPLRYRIMVQTEIVFTGLAALALAYRLIMQSSTTPRVGWVFLVVLAAFFVAFCLFYPTDQRG